MTNTERVELYTLREKVRELRRENWWLEMLLFAVALPIIVSMSISLWNYRQASSPPASSPASLHALNAVHSDPPSHD
jgi:hypothetical protein